MHVDDLILVSVDDHLVEPPDLFKGHLPAKYADRAPKIIRTDDGSDVWVLPLDTVSRQPYPFVNSSHAERLAYFSPNGQWVAYQSNESGRAEIYLRPFPGPGGRFPVSSGGGAQPQWRNDGKELYFIAPDAKLMAVSTDLTGTSPTIGSPSALFQTRIYLGGSEQPDRGQYDVARDGRFLINTVLGEASAPPIVIVQNWAPR